LAQLTHLEDEVRLLTTERDELENAVAGGVDEKQASVERLRTETGEITDNIDALEGRLKGLLGGDREAMEEIRQICYGEFYVQEAEGLPDLDGL